MKGITMKSIVIIGYIIIITALVMACTPLPPYAVIIDYDTSVVEGQTACFEGYGYTRDGGTASYEWDFPPQAYYIQGDKTETASCKFYPAGSYNVLFTIISSTGLSTTLTCTVTVSTADSHWYVSPDGDDNYDGLHATYEGGDDGPFRTIQMAIDSASPGHEIIVKPGTESIPVVYYEQLDMKGKSLNIHTDNPDNWEAVKNSIIDAQERGTTVIYRGNEVNGVGEDEVAALEGFTITGGAPAGDGLALHLTLDDSTGTSAEDLSDKGRDGTLENEPVWATDRNGNAALLFDGTNDYVEITDYKGVVGGGSRTCTAWIKTASVSGEILSWGEEYFGGRWIIRVNEGGQLRAEVQGGNIIGTSIINDDAWHHVAVVVENDGSPDINEARLYVDGQLEMISYSVDEPINSGSVQNVLIGVYFEAGVPRWFQGLIDDVRIYSRALGDGEIRGLDEVEEPIAHWKLDENANDATGNGHNGTGPANPVYGDGMVGDAISLNGTDQDISVANHPQLKPELPLTVAAWVYTENSGTNGIIIQTDDWNTTYSGVYLRLKSDGIDTIALGYGDGASSSYRALRNIVGTTVLEPHRWYHIIGVIRGAEDMTIYINGKDDRGQCGGVGSGNLNYTDHDITIGSRHGIDSFFQGQIDDVCIYNYGLTAAEAKGLYRNCFNDGGGIKGHGASANISKCIIKDNSSETDGGGMDGVNGAISHSYIMGNTAAGNGGGLSGCNGDIRNCVVAKNAALNAGAMDHCDGDIVNCTIADNGAMLIGGGLQDCVGSIVNSILWNNRDNSGISQESQIRDWSAAISYNCIQNWPSGGTENISGDPSFVNHNAGDYRLDAASMCINVGDPNLNYADQVDLDGNSRAEGHDLRIDLGAYEFQQTIWYVDDSVTESGDGLTWATAKKTIQEGINVSSNNEIVLVANGTYTGTGNRDIDFSEDLESGSRAITVRSQNGPEQCVIDCNGLESAPHRGFYFHTGEGVDSVVDGFRIKKGYVNGVNGFPVIYGENGTASGGVIGCDGSSPTIRNCFIENSTATQYGGGLFACRNSRPIIQNCVIMGNKAYRGAAVYSKYNDSHPRLVNCTMLHNIANNSGGAIYHFEGDSTLINCILYNNSSPAIGIQTDATCSISYSCISEVLPNETWLIRGDVLKENTNPYFISYPNSGDDQTWGTEDDYGGDLRLQGISPCLDAGTNDVTDMPETDITGLLRVSDGNDDGDTIVDMGAYEYQVNHAPIAKDDPGLTGQSIDCSGGGSVTINVLANDFDPEGDDLCVESNVVQPAHGTAVIGNGGLTIIYTPDSYFSGVDSFQYQASDSQLESNWATVKLNVQQSGQPPVAQDDEMTILRGSAETVIDVLGNDTDADAGDTLFVLSCGLAVHGEVVNNGVDVTYRPAAGYSGTDRFSYTVCDGGGLSDEGTVVVYVMGVDAGADQAIELPHCRAFLDGAVRGAPAGATIGWDVFDAPLGAGVVFGSYTVESPDTVAEFSLPGTYVVQLEVDWQGLSARDLAVITVRASEKAGNRPPRVEVSAEPSELTLPDHSATLNWAVSDDGVSRGLSQWWEVVDGPIAGEVLFGTYTPQSRTVPVSFSADGVYILRLTVSDGIDQTTATILIRVNPDSQANRPPVVDAGPNQQASLIAGPQSITLNDPNIIATDPDQGPQLLAIQWTILNDTSGIGFTSASDILNPTLTVTTPGQYVLQLAASDGATTVTDTMAISTSSVMVDAGPDALVILPDDDEVMHALSGWCESQPAGLYSDTEWQVIVQPASSNVQFDPALPAVSIWDPNVTFTKSGDYVFKLIAKDSQGEEVGSDEVYIKVKLASQEYTTYLYLYDLDLAGKREWEVNDGKPLGSCPPANLVFSSYEEDTKISYQTVDPNGILGQLYDANPNVVDANLIDPSGAAYMQKGQYSYVDGEDGVYKVTSTNKKFTVLAGDVMRDSTSGYFVMSKNGVGVDKEFYSHIGSDTWNGRRLVVFSYQDNTHITIKWDSNKDGICDDSDPNLIMQKYDLLTGATEDIIMDNYVLNEGDHVYRIPDDNNIYIHVLADKPISVEQCNDSGFYVPSSNGQWVGQNFNVYVDSIADENLEGTIYAYIAPLAVFAHETGTEVSIGKNAVGGTRVSALVRHSA